MATRALTLKPSPASAAVNATSTGSRAPTGLSEAEAKSMLARVGPNVLATKKTTAWKKFITWFVSPIPLMLVAASALSYATGKEADAGLIFALLVANYVIQLWHESKANKAVEKLEQHLAPYASVRRDGRWQRMLASQVVPGDLIALRVGSIIPADAKLVNAKDFSSNESMLTGESLPKDKKTGDIVYSAAFVAAGAGEAIVTATGTRTYFGKAIKTIELARKRSTLEADILSISKLLAFFSIAAIIVLTVVIYLSGGKILDIAQLDISLLIAGIPVALPTVMSLIISVGVVGLARGGAVVRRLSALEDLANVNLLLSDKTGTLTENKIRVVSLVTFGAWSEAEALQYAASATDPAASNPLELAVREAALTKRLTILPQTSLTPGDSERKRTTAVIKDGQASWIVTLGAPPTVGGFTRFDSAGSKRFADAIAEATRRGDRTLLLATKKGAVTERNLDPIAVLFLADTLRPDARKTIEAMRGEGIDVKMLTGDGVPIAREVAHELGLRGDLYDRSVFDDPAVLRHALSGAAGFAEVLPHDKYLATEAAKKYARVAVTGDGANDIPSVSDADVGIAVASSVDALRETADIVLLTNGLGVIATAIVEARKVFMRLYHYSLYRISESSRLILTIAIIGLWVGTYPLTPIQVLLLAFLNDVPIISIAFDRVKIPKAPASINGKQRALSALSFGFAGILDSMLMFVIAYVWLHLPWGWVQTLFFLKLVVSGHMLIYVAHTEQRWFRWFPSWQVIAAVSATQALATIWAFYGFFTTPIPLWLIAFVWVWSFFWMQITEFFKMLAALPFRRVAPVLTSA